MCEECKTLFPKGLHLTGRADNQTTDWDRKWSTIIGSAKHETCFLCTRLDQNRTKYLAHLSLDERAAVLEYDEIEVTVLQQPSIILVQFHSPRMEVKRFFLVTAGR